MKIRGTASHIAEKYMQLARDSQTSSDPVAAENYFQHAEHYFRLIATAQEQFRQQNPYYNNPAPTPGAPTGAADDNYDDGDDDGQPFAAQGEQGNAPQPPQPQAQPYLPRDAQPFPPRDQPQHRNPQHQPQHQPRPHQNQQPRPIDNNAAPEVTGLPAFITGGQPQPVIAEGDANGQNGHRGWRSSGSFRPPPQASSQRRFPPGLQRQYATAMPRPAPRRRRRRRAVGAAGVVPASPDAAQHEVMRR